MDRTRIGPQFYDRASQSRVVSTHTAIIHSEQTHGGVQTIGLDRGSGDSIEHDPLNQERIWLSPAIIGSARALLSKTRGSKLQIAVIESISQLDSQVASSADLVLGSSTFPR